MDQGVPFFGFVDGIKLGGVADTAQSCAVIQRDLDKMGRKLGRKEHR